MSFKMTLLIALLILGIFVTYQYIQTRRLISIGVDISDKAIKYEQHPKNPQRHFLVIGDSSAVGTGASEPSESTAGRLGADYPKADITNVGVNGSKTHEIKERLEELDDKRYDLILIQIGGNDIVRFTSYQDVEKNSEEILKSALTRSNKVIIMHGGNVGTAKLLPLGTRWIFEKRTQKVRDIYIKLAAKYQGVEYVDLWRSRDEDPFAQDPKKYYAADFFHPSSAGYAEWYEHIRTVINSK